MIDKAVQQSQNVVVVEGGVVRPPLLIIVVLLKERQLEGVEQWKQLLLPRFLLLGIVPVDIVLEGPPQGYWLHQLLLPQLDVLPPLVEEDVGRIPLVIVHELPHLLEALQLVHLAVVVADPLGLRLVAVLAEGEVVPGIGRGPLREDKPTLWMMME